MRQTRTLEERANHVPLDSTPGKSGNTSLPQPNCRKRRNEEAKKRTNGETSDENNENEDNCYPAAAVRTRINSTTHMEVMRMMKS